MQIHAHKLKPPAARELHTAALNNWVAPEACLLPWHESPFSHRVPWPWHTSHSATLRPVPTTQLGWLSFPLHSQLRSGCIHWSKSIVIGVPTAYSFSSSHSGNVNDCYTHMHLELRPTVVVMDFPGPYGLGDVRLRV